MNMVTLALAITGGVLVGVALVLKLRLKHLNLLPIDEGDNKALKRFNRRKRLPTILFWLGVWLGVGQLITLVFGASQKEFKVEIFAPLVTVGPLKISSSVVTGWVIIAILTLLALAFRFLALPKFREQPQSGFQNVMELAVEKLAEYTESCLSHPLGENLGAYMFTVGVYLVACAAAELFGQRAPSSDLMMTFALALITFFLINYYGIREKGLRGRVKSMSQPTPIILPIKILSDIATPVSLACRLFGNMLGGLIVMELLYFALGNMAFGIPAVLGLYFNVFHPLIQAFIFITLSLTFINEAVE